MGANMILDVDRIKDNIDLIELAGHDTSLRQKTATESTGPCPRCGGTDRFNVQRKRFLCRYCHPKWGDAIEYVQWLDDRCSFLDACSQLEANTVTHRLTPATVAHKSAPAAWKDPAWQSSARSDLQSACDRLWNQPDGETARQYLASRSITLDTCIAFDLGCALTWNTHKQAELPAIWMPWQNRSITAIQYRFFGPGVEHGDRFGQRKAGDRILFGAHLLDHARADTLLLCEGELNAVSIRQMCYGWLPIDVLSWGPEDNAERADVVMAVRKLVAKYKYVVTWADKRDRAISAKSAYGAHRAIYSQNNQDANALLQAGVLGNIMYELAVQGGQSAR